MEEEMESMETIDFMTIASGHSFSLMEAVLNRIVGDLMTDPSQENIKKLQCLFAGVLYQVRSNISANEETTCILMQALSIAVNDLFPDRSEEFKSKTFDRYVEAAAIEIKRTLLEKSVC